MEVTSTGSTELHTGVQISNKEVAVKPKFAIQNIFKAGTLCKY